MQLPQASEHTAQRENLIPLYCRTLYKYMIYIDNLNRINWSLHFSHKTKIFLFSYLDSHRIRAVGPAWSWGWRVWINPVRDSYMASLPLWLLLPLTPSVNLSDIVPLTFSWSSLAHSLCPGCFFCFDRSCSSLDLASSPMPSDRWSHPNTQAHRPCSPQPRWSCPVTCVIVRLPPASPFDCKPHSGRVYHHGPRALCCARHRGGSQLTSAEQMNKYMSKWRHTSMKGWQEAKL